MAVANPLGLAVGSLLPGVIIGDTRLDRIEPYLAVQAAMAFVVCIATLFMQSHPPTVRTAQVTALLSLADHGMRSFPLSQNLCSATVRQVYRFEREIYRLFDNVLAGQAD